MTPKEPDSQRVVEIVQSQVSTVDAVAQANSEPWDFVLAVAQGCFDYGGGYRSDDAKLAIFHHGIQTVINSLTSARDKGFKDTQVVALYQMGRAALSQPEGSKS